VESSSPEKGVLIINSLIDHYDKDRSLDKETIFRNTSKFINSRLDLISGELKSVDSRIASFKKDNIHSDIKYQGDLTLRDASDLEKKVGEYRTQLYLANLVRESSEVDRFGLLPSNIGLEDASVEKSIKHYNDLILERSDLLRSATLQSPTVLRLEANIDLFRNSLNVSLDNYATGLKEKIKSLELQQSALSGSLGNYPDQEQRYQEISRQQKVVESMYLFLMEKREQNEINASATPANIKVVDYAYGYGVPISPKRAYVLLAGFALGLCIPIGLLYLRFMLDNKLRSKKDLEELVGAPILGQVPKVKERTVEENSRTPLAESLRILRTNISYMLGQGSGQGAIVLYVTSTVSGEGKSFISTNLASIIAQSGKKVLLVGADIRSPKVLEYLGIEHLKHNQAGITQYLVDPSISVASLVLDKPKGFPFDVIYSGYIAPNPAELLMNGNFQGIIAYGRQNYDYLVVDTAPVSLVADTLLISEFADLTLYVSRAGF